MARHRNTGLQKRCDCPRARWPKCPHGWHFSFQWRTKRYRLSLDRETGRRITSKTEAEREADRLRTAIREGRQLYRSDVSQTHTSELTFDAYAAIFLERYSKARGKVSWKNDRCMLLKMGVFSNSRGRLGQRDIKNITRG